MMTFSLIGDVRVHAQLPLCFSVQGIVHANKHDIQKSGLISGDGLVLRQGLGGTGWVGVELSQIAVC